MGNLIQTILRMNNKGGGGSGGWMGNQQEDPSETGYGNYGYWNDFWTPDQSFWNTQAKTRGFSLLNPTYQSRQQYSLSNPMWGGSGNTLLDVLSKWFGKFGR